MPEKELNQEKAEKLIKIVDRLVIKKNETEKMRKIAESKVSKMRQTERLKQRLEEIIVPSLEEIKE